MEEVKKLSANDIADIIISRRDTYIAECLEDLELMFKNGNQPNFHRIRKVFLDYFNGYSRSVLDTFLGGNIEGS